MADTQTDEIRTLVVAGYASVRAGLHALLADASGIAVVGAVEGTGDSLVRLLPALRPSVLLLDTTGDSAAWDSLGDFLALQADKTALPVALVVVADCAERDLPRLFAARLPGWGYLGRDTDGAQIIAAVRAAAEGLIVLNHDTRVPLATDTANRAPAKATVPGPVLPAGNVPQSVGETLTPREIEVIQLMARGLPNKQIASRLGISLHTAKFHVAQILGKLDAASRTEAVTVGARRGYVTL